MLTDEVLLLNSDEGLYALLRLVMYVNHFGLDRKTVSSIWKHFFFFCTIVFQIM